MAQTIPCSQVLVARGVYLLAVQVDNFVLFFNYDCNISDV